MISLSPLQSKGEGFATARQPMSCFWARTPAEAKRHRRKLIPTRTKTRIQKAYAAATAPPIPANIGKSSPVIEARELAHLETWSSYLALGSLE